MGTIIAAIIAAIAAGVTGAATGASTARARKEGQRIAGSEEAQARATAEREKATGLRGLRLQENVASLGLMKQAQAGQDAERQDKLTKTQMMAARLMDMSNRNRGFRADVSRLFGR